MGRVPPVSSQQHGGRPGHGPAPQQQQWPTRGYTPRHSRDVTAIFAKPLAAGSGRDDSKETALPHDAALTKADVNKHGCGPMHGCVRALHARCILAVHLYLSQDVVARRSKHGPAARPAARAPTRSTAPRPWSWPECSAFYNPQARPQMRVHAFGFPVSAPLRRRLGYSHYTYLEAWSISHRDRWWRHLHVASLSWRRKRKHTGLRIVAIRWPLDFKSARSLLKYCLNNDKLTRLCSEEIGSV